MDQVENVIRSATAKSKDGRIDVTDFLNEAAGSMRYGVFTPMEVGDLRS
jgi:solute carrier family 25 aspartate/glutamate transporter 12/13